MFIEEYEDEALIDGKYFHINQRDPISEIMKGNGIATLYDGKGRLIKKIKYKNGNPI